MDAELWAVITKKKKGVEAKGRSRGTAEKFTSPQWKGGVRMGRTRAKDKERRREKCEEESPRRETCFHSRLRLFRRPTAASL